jgi:uncharacterized protein
MGTIVGREEEVAILHKLCNSQEPEFLAVYGRRRIGKTFLISQFFQDKGIYFELTGMQDADVQSQLKNFARVYADVFNAGNPIDTPPTWSDAFDLLRKQAQQKGRARKLILFLDELPWLASPQSRFLPALEYTWNRYLSRERNIILIVCGSAASWMIRKILYNRGGLHGRLTQTMEMRPFTLPEMRRFLAAQNVALPAPQLIELHLTTGGVAKYLTKLEPGQSAQQLTQGRYFARHAPLRGEFLKLFSSLFKDYERHVAIVDALARSHYGLTIERLRAEVGMPSGGTFTALLSDLEASGFITFIRQFGNAKKGGKYLLTDEFTLFYVKWVQEREKDLEDLTGYWQRQARTQAFRIWAGYAFEMLCVKNLSNIKQQLGIAGVTTWVSQWRNEDAQIDLVIDRADDSINLCEIKFHSAEVVLTEADAKALQRKRDRFEQATRTRKALFTTLITVNGVARNAHYLAAVHAHVRAEEFVGPPF